MQIQIIEKPNPGLSEEVAATTRWSKQTLTHQ
jgi:hypothetical protein